MELPDISKQAETIGIDKESLLELYGIYLEQTEVDINSLKSLMGAGDWEKIPRIAHHMKGASLNLELTEIADASLLLEKKGAAGDRQFISDQFTRILTAFNLLKEQLTGEDFGK